MTDINEIARAHLVNLGEPVHDDEVWLLYGDDPNRLLSTEGRVLTRPHSVPQANRYGGAHWRRVEAHVSLCAADREPHRRREQAKRRNGCAWDCRLVNLVWQDDWDAERLLEWVELYAEGMPPERADIEVDIVRSKRCDLLAALERDHGVRVPALAEITSEASAAAMEAVAVLGPRGMGALERRARVLKTARSSPRK